MNPPSLDKSRLVYGHQIRQQRCKAIGHELSNQFGRPVDKAHGPEVFHLDGIDLLRQKGDESRVEKSGFGRMTMMNS